MRRPRTELVQEREALSQIATAERRRRNELRKQAALYGYRADPSIPLELEDIERRLKAYDEELMQLETQIAEADEPIAEVLYRITLAEEWSTPEGRPTVLGAARLELKRLQLGITPDRARLIEQIVRSDLAREALIGLNVNALLGVVEESNHGLKNMALSIEPHDSASVTIEVINMSQTFAQFNPFEHSLRVIGRAVHLDSQRTVQLLLRILPANPRLHVDSIGPHLMNINQVSMFEDDQILFVSFLTELHAALSSLDNA